MRSNSLPKLSSMAKKFGVLLTLGLLAAQVFPAAGVAWAAPPFPDPAMEAVWNRTDKPVQDGTVTRSWTWGPTTFSTRYEPYAEGPGGQHLVTYLDKSRMEINNPAGDRNNPFFVTNGLLVVEMMTGKIQTGNNSFQQVTAFNGPVAGDPGNPNTPTYTRLASFASLNGNNRAANRVGQPISEGLQQTGSIGSVPNLAGYARYGVYDTTLGHNIADVFWAFMNQTGPVYVNGRIVNDTVIDWTFAMGYPLTEPYWMPIQVGTQQRWVLVQAFQRRMLTYSPDNPPGFRVEMGNVGRSYYDWRYNGQPAPPTPVPPPAGPASIALSPSQGDRHSSITVTGVNFPPNSQITVKVERSDAGYSSSVATIGAGADGKFAVSFALPSDAARYDNVTVSATSNAGGVRATAPFPISFNPAININPTKTIVSGGTMTVFGREFPTAMSVKIGLLFDGARNAEFPASVRTDEDGAFETSFNIGQRPVGSRFLVFAVASNGMEVSYADKVTVAATPPPPVPAIAVSPTSLQAGQGATAYGSGWTPGSQVTISLTGGGRQENVAIANVDRAGNFAVGFAVGGQWTNAGQLTVTGRSNTGQVATTLLNVMPSGGGTNLEYGLDMSVQTYRGFGNNYVKVSGRGWRAGLNLTISVVSSRGDVNFGVANAAVRSDGTWQASFSNTGPWVGRTDIGVRASDATNAYASGRRLPLTTLTFVSGRTYQLRGANWGPATQVQATFQVNGEDNQGLGSTGVDANGNFVVNVNIPGGSGERQIAVSTKGGAIIYSAIVGMDQAGGSGLDEAASSLSPPGEEKRVPAMAPLPEAVPLVGMPTTGASDYAGALVLAATALVAFVVGLVIRRATDRLVR